MSVRPALQCSSIGSAPITWLELRAAGARCALTAVELSAMDDTYAWSRVDEAPNFTAPARLFGRGCRSPEEDRAQQEACTRSRRGGSGGRRDPRVVAPGRAGGAAVVPAERAARGADVGERIAAMTLRRRAPRSGQAQDGPALQRRARRRRAARRVRLRPRPCRRRPSSTATTSSTTTTSRAARAHARAGRERWRGRLGCRSASSSPRSRFVAKKNLLRLLDAYADYRRRSGADAWHLVLLGDGHVAGRGRAPHRPARHLAGDVLLAGFKQYDELPA